MAESNRGVKTVSNPPEWVVEKAEETSETLNVPFHHALELEIETAMTWYGFPLPENDPAKEQRRQKAIEHHRVLDPE